MPDADVLVVGAGLSGIDVAVRLGEKCPDLDYVVVEARDDLGGTWDLFCYPGVRSDSDFFTLAYPFHPWRGRDAIVGGEQIREYLHDVVRHYDLDRNIRYGVRVCSADWQSETARWRVTLETEAGEQVVTPRFVIMCTGYYDYARPHDPVFAGLDAFDGRVVHPQFWPEDLDVDGRRVAVVGSGATAITLVPALTEHGARVTMVQRTPTYVVAQPRRDAVTDVARRVLSPARAHLVVAAKNALRQWAFYRACRRAPRQMRHVLRSQAVKAVGSAAVVDAHLAPDYDPWDQRVCITPDGDFFAALRRGEATIVTGHIERFVGDGLRMTDGTTVPADVVVTATGLRISLLGDVPLFVDGRPVDLARAVAYQGAMLSGLPNLGFVVGYLNASWTLRADATARLLTRVLRRLVDTGAARVVPVPPEGLSETAPMLQLDAGYLRRAAGLMPRIGPEYPWAYEQDVVRDRRAVAAADLDDGLCWTSADEPGR
ncbi:flavin-containing monooxygenase [Mobilicoccus massiliensis]|uniref:flavin-containing monooxygenase n=1 Tax=Mobilicoccus massiliensis TaxID=1522310 RepID=UPI001FEA331F|nr:NAD(P)/FAD-dependent oxidoreductase [Mobilicoccus massiliensis]